MPVPVPVPVPVLIHRVLLVPRWAGTPDSDFYPWLEDALLDHDALTIDRAFRLALLPSPDAPQIEPCVGVLQRLLGPDPSNTLLIGHSVGCQVVLRTLERLDPAVTVAGALLVAGWFDLDQPWPAIKPWIDTPLDDARVRRACSRIHVLVGDDDPYTADHEATCAAFETRLGATTERVHGARHFNRAREPAVLRAAVAMARADG